MEIFCVFPFMVDFMMRSGYFDDNGHVHTFGLPPIISNMVGVSSLMRGRKRM